MDVIQALQQGNAWLLVPSAIFLGALHGLEPGHSKTMMAAFIIAVRGTVAQAVLLGLSATVSHTAVVWVIAMVGLYYGKNGLSETSEPYFHILSAVLIIGVALWMVWRTWQQQNASIHQHAHGHSHAHHDDHHHQPTHAPLDAHAAAHAKEIDERFANQQVTNSQIMFFGLTGGLIPCPAAITVLLLCLQVKQVALGATLVLGFSIGLAITMVAAGAVAALGLKHAAAKSSRFSQYAAKAPYLSGVLMLLIGIYVGYQGLRGLGGL
jgi:ABC-type nickel/cobalt efflux system permease component RcnA